MSDRPTADASVGPEVAAAPGAAAGWQPTPLPPLPPLPPGEIGWMGVPAGAALWTVIAAHNTACTTISSKRTRAPVVGDVATP
eukprot:scaffold8841_cov53-Phaeocystis_antarctica.AAC.4